MKKESLDILENIFSILRDHKATHQHHSRDCDYFADKYVRLKQAILDGNDKEMESCLEWNRLYAPRIIYEGIGNKILMNEIEKLNSIFR